MKTKISRAVCSANAVKILKELDAIFKAQTQTEFQHEHIYSYKHNQLNVFLASIESESTTAEAMAKRYVMNKIRAEMDRSMDEEVSKRFENQHFNWVPADPVYRG
jgi:hypothetical protein